MKKQIDLHWSKFLTLAAFAAMTVIISSFVCVSAENNNHAIKVTDDFKV